MPNQSNYRSDITTQTDNRFSPSRIVRIPTENILLEEVPASFGFDNEDTVEVHFYSIPDNKLILSSTVSLNDNNLKTHVVSYADGTYKNYLRIDFSRFFLDNNLLLVPGDYRMVVNFFSDEIGSYDNRILNLDVITESRTEVQVSFNNTTDEVIFAQNQYLLREFVEPSFNKVDAVGVAEKIFKSGVELQNSEEGLTSTNVIENLEVNGIQTYENTTDRIERINLTEIFSQQIDDFLKELYTFVAQEIIINGDDRIQEDQYKEIIRKVIKQNINRMNSIVDSRIKIV